MTSEPNLAPSPTAPIHALEPRPYDQCCELLEYLVRALQGTTYRVGQLRFTDPTDPSARLGSERSVGDLFWRHDIDVVVDPRRGVLLVQDCPALDGLPADHYGNFVEQRYAELRTIEERVRARLHEDAFWHGREVPLASVIVAGEREADQIDLPATVPPRAVVAAEALGAFGADLSPLFEAALPAGADRSAEALARLTREFTGGGELGTFVDEAYWLELYRNVEHDLAIIRAMRSEPENDDDLSRCYPHQELLVRGLRRSGFEFGTLHFDEPYPPGQHPEGIAPLPPNLRDGWIHVDEIDLVIHPLRGALLVGYCDEDDDPAQVLATLHRRERRLRARIDADPIWHDHPFVMGPVLIAPDHPRATVGRDPRIVLGREDTARVTERLLDIFDYHDEGPRERHPQHCLNFARALRVMHGKMGGFYELVARDDGAPLYAWDAEETYYDA